MEGDIWEGVGHRCWGRVLVTDGIYSHIRHPQYVGIILMALGLLIHWATIPLIVMWPILVIRYITLARRGERELERGIGEEYLKYKERVPMFIPSLRGGRPPSEVRGFTSKQFN